MSHRNLTAAQAAARLGVSAKALRVWETAGLLTPGRTPAGWRAYGPEDFARIHQILALRNLGLDLRRIGDLLVGRPDALAAVLDLQATVLRRRRAETERALTLIEAAQARLRAGEALSLDDFSQLIQETQVTQAQPQPLSADDWNQIFEPIWARRYTAAERDDLAARKAEAAGAFDAPKIVQAWTALIEEARQLMELGDATSPAAIDLAQRWLALARQFTAGDAGLEAKVAQVWQDAFADPKAAARLPITPEMFAFVGAAARAGGIA